jgi:thiol-disulfide isomerase/thioredoxin
MCSPDPKEKKDAASGNITERNDLISVAKQKESPGNDETVTSKNHNESVSVDGSGDNSTAEHGEQDVKKPKGPVAPDFTLTDTEGNQFVLSRQQGKVLLINFWATWCGPCRMEIPALIELSKKITDEKFEIIGVNLDYTEKQAIKGKKAFKIPYRVMYDAGNKVMRKYRVVSIPSLFIVDTEGVLRFRHVGYDPRNFARIEKEIRSLLVE